MSESDLRTVQDIVIRYGWFIDDRDWAGLASIVADTIDLDFTSLWGGAPEKVSGADLVARWRAMSEGLDTTQHLITGILPTIEGDTVTAVANLVAVHRRDGAPGDPLWTVGGTYRFSLRRADRSWVIDGLSLRVAWVTGNQAVITGQGAPDGPTAGGR